MRARSLDSGFSSFLKDFISIVEGSETILIFSHDNMDPDSIGSIAGLIDFIQQACKGTRRILIYPSKLSKKSVDIVNIFELTLDFLKDTIDTTSILPVLVDMNTLSSLNGLGNELIHDIQVNAVILDHHFSEPEPEGKLKWIDAGVRSNCEIIFSLFKASGHHPRQPAANLMACGLMFDTGFLRHATNDSIYVLNELIGLGVDVNYIRSILLDVLDVSERIARLKAASR
nr:DHH family phosphoesterase [Candidatus Sigynarchaeota archaeon]